MELKRILLVDDSENDVELALSALAEYNLANRVDIATDGVDALDYLYVRGRHAARRFGNPMVILLDLKLPKLNGLEVLKVIKEDPGLRLIPVVILTSSRESSDVLEGYGIGANAFVVKPVDFTHFVKVIKELGYFWAIINEKPPDLSSGTDT
jgi:CheY-like chemotaxis protein